jgi:hypothetical protein
MGRIFGGRIMGDHAQDSLDYNADYTLDHLDYLEGNLSLDDAYEKGIIDELGFAKELKYFSTPPIYDVQGLEIYSLRMLQLFENGSFFDLLKIKRSQRNQDPKILNEIKILVEKVKTRYSMLLGMSQYPINNKPFSDKQEKWLSTNWKGGYQQFEIDLKKDHGGIQQNLKKILKRIDQIKREYTA